MDWFTKIQQLCKRKVKSGQAGVSSDLSTTKNQFPLEQNNRPLPLVAQPRRPTKLQSYNDDLCVWTSFTFEFIDQHHTIIMISATTELFELMKITTVISGEGDEQ